MTAGTALPLNHWITKVRSDHHLHLPVNDVFSDHNHAFY